jgi:hypothetical protein
MTQGDSGQVLESVKFLLKSVRQLSDRFRDTNDKLQRGFEGVEADVADLSARLEVIEKELVNVSDGLHLPQGGQAAPELPVRPGTEDMVVPALNLPLEDVIDTYATTPVLLEPFCRPCSLSGRTLSGEIEQVELEIFSQGSTWALELLEEAWVLLPRPGSLERRAQMQTLERLFEIEGVDELPATLHLHRPATALAIQHGRRWTLRERGLLSVTPDPLRRSTSRQLRDLEERLGRLEARLG